MFTYSRGYPRWLANNLYTTIFQNFKCVITKICIFWMLKSHTDTHVSDMHTYFTFITCPLTRKHFGSRSVLFDFLCWCHMYILRNKATFKCNIGGCHVQAVSHWLLISWSWAGSNHIRTACEKATLCLQVVMWFPMENFLFCSIYLLALTQKSEIILTTCHKIPKSQMHYTDVVFINGKDYTQILRYIYKYTRIYTTMLFPKFPRLEYKINI